MTRALRTRGDKSPYIAPPTAFGETQILDNGDQHYLAEPLAAMLVMMGMIKYSPEDGPNARVYRLINGYTIEDVKAVVW